MKTDMYLKLQKKFGGQWVATNKTGESVFARGKNVDSLFANLKKKNLSPKKAVIGFIEKYGQINAYFSVSIQKD